MMAVDGSGAAAVAAAAEAVMAADADALTHDAAQLEMADYRHTAADDAWPTDGSQSYRRHAAGEWLSCHCA